jgi:hypothetical protein
VPTGFSGRGAFANARWNLQMALVLMAAIGFWDPLARWRKRDRFANQNSNGAFTNAPLPISEVVVIFFRMTVPNFPQSGGNESSERCKKSSSNYPRNIAPPRNLLGAFANGPYRESESRTKQ